MRLTFYFIIVLLASNLLNVERTMAQQQFKVKYVFKGSKFNGSLYEIADSSEKDVEIGYLLSNGKRNPIHRMPKGALIPKKIKYQLYGLIDRRTGDSLFIHFFHITKSSHFKDPQLIDSADNDANFVYIIKADKPFVIDKWVQGMYGKYFSVPFQYNMFTATAVPFRVNLSTGAADANFLNFNVAYLWVWGRTKYFENDDIDPRNFHVGFGPFVGLTQIANETTSNNNFGITYGLTAVISVHNLNLLPSIGLENGFNKLPHPFVPYIGFGVGFNLVSLYSPSN